jgi:hypothetical protein
MALSVCNFKNIHKDKLGFLIGSGPSLRKINKSLLNNYVTMTVNSSIVYKPDCDYFVSDDWSVSNWSYFIRDLAQSDCTKFLYNKKFQGNFCHLKKHQTCMFDHTWYYEPKTGRYNMKGLSMSQDCNKPIIGARTSLASGLHLMHIMGCNPIVLLGCDCKMEDDKRYFWEYPGHTKPVRLDRRNDFPVNVKLSEGKRQCKEILEYWNLFEKMNKDNISGIINASSDSILEIFPKHSIEEVMEKYGDRVK